MDALRYSVLAEELARACEEGARLSEMIEVLGRRMDETRLRQLRIELFILNKRATRLKRAILNQSRVSPALA